MHDFIEDIANATLGEWLEKRVREFVESNPRESYSSLRIMASQDAFVATELQLAEAHLLENLPITASKYSRRDIKYRYQSELSRQFEQKILKR
jgi:hypothetical protein